MEKTKLLTFTVIGLLLINLGILSFLLLSGPKEHRPPGNGPDGPKNFIIEKLHFDTEQIKKYEKLIQWHRRNIADTEDKIREVKNDLYQQLNENPVDEEKKDSLIIALASHQKQIESIHFKHFQDIKMLCRKDQMDDFAQLTSALSRLFSKPPHHRK